MILNYLTVALGSLLTYRPQFFVSVYDVPAGRSRYLFGNNVTDATFQEGILLYYVTDG